MTNQPTTEAELKAEGYERCGNFADLKMFVNDNKLRLVDVLGVIRYEILIDNKTNA